MTICTVYIGDLDDKSFHWDGGDWNGNIPSSLTADFPPTSGHYNACFHKWVDKAGVECKKTDFGGWVAKVTQNQLLDFIDHCYGSDPGYNDPDRMLMWDGRPYLVDRLNAIRDFVSELDGTKLYALVATEF